MARVALGGDVTLTHQQNFLALSEAAFRRLHRGAADAEVVNLFSSAPPRWEYLEADLVLPLVTETYEPLLNEEKSKTGRQGRHFEPNLANGQRRLDGRRGRK